MSEKILVPVLGESITEASVSKWLKNKGDSVSADEAVVELETDKVNLEVPSAISGVLSEINYKEGDTVEVGAILGVISENNVKVDKTTTIEKIKPKNIEIQKNDEKNNSFKLEENAIDQGLEEEPTILNEEEPLILDEEVENEKVQIMDDYIKKNKLQFNSENLKFSSKLKK